MNFHQNRWLVRGLFLLVILISAGWLGWMSMQGPPLSPAERAPPSDGVTVVTYSHNFESKLVAYGPSGERVATHDHYDSYWDVDPSPAGRNTVLVTVQNITAESPCRQKGCQIMSIIRLNLSTGADEVLFQRHYSASETTVKWHDVDRVGENRYALADIADDRMMVVDTKNDTFDWGWTAYEDYPRSTGDERYADWTHLNDVEKVNETTIMVSLRNQDSVVFIHEKHGLLEGMTLGCEDCYGTLYEQHNPDYIPEERGGPAVIVSDSHNNRIVEYERRGGEWVQTWEWSDRQLQWPRDADRLPNGNTLITDAHGERVIEVTPDGEVVWEFRVKGGYDAERLHTGDESAGGTAAEELGYESRQASDDYPLLHRSFRGITRPKIATGVRTVLPMWAGPVEAVALLTIFYTLLVWGFYEFRCFPYRIKFDVELVDRREYAWRGGEDDDDDDDGGESE